MATSFSAAALGAEGLAADVTMLVGNGYVPGHAAYALELLRDDAGVRRPLRGPARRTRPAREPTAHALPQRPRLRRPPGRRRHQPRGRGRPHRLRRATTTGPRRTTARARGRRGRRPARRPAHAGLRRRPRAHRPHRLRAHRARPDRDASLAATLDAVRGLRATGPRATASWSARAGTRPAGPRAARPPATSSSGRRPAGAATSPASTATPRWSRPALAALVPGLEGLDGWTPDGRVERDAHHAVRAVLEGLIGRDDRLAAARAACRAMAAPGHRRRSTRTPPRTSAPSTRSRRCAGRRPRPGCGPPSTGASCSRVDTARRLGVAGLAGDLVADGAFGSRTAALSAPYADRPDTCGHAYVDADQVRDHVVACTERRPPGRVPRASATPPSTRSARASRPPSGARHDGAARGRGTGSSTSRCRRRGSSRRWAGCGVMASVQPVFDALWGGPDGMYAARLGERWRGTNPFARPGRRRGPARVRLGLAGHRRSVPGRPSGRRCTTTTTASGSTPRAAFRAHTRGGWRSRPATTTAGTWRSAPAPTSPSGTSPGGLADDGLPDLTPGTAAAGPAPARRGRHHHPRPPRRPHESRRARPPSTSSTTGGKLDLDPATVRKARALAAQAGRPIVDLARQHTTVSVERATLRLAGLAGADAEGTPWVNRLADVVRATSPTRSASSTASRCRSGTRCCAARPTTSPRSPRRRRPARCASGCPRAGTPRRGPRGRPQAGRRPASRRWTRAAASASG